MATFDEVRFVSETLQWCPLKGWISHPDACDARSSAAIVAITKLFFSTFTIFIYNLQLVSFPTGRGHQTEKTGRQVRSPSREIGVSGARRTPNSMAHICQIPQIQLFVWLGISTVFRGFPKRTVTKRLLITNK